MTNRDEQRKAKQAGRREARRLLGQARELMTDRICFERLETRFMKPKPRFLPTFIWRLWAGTVLDFKKIDERQVQIKNSVVG